MITQNQRFELKQRYGNIYSTVLGKVEYIFRPLTIEEYRYILDSTGDGKTDADLEDVAVSFGVVSPNPLDLDKMKAGHVSALAEEILRVSGFIDIDFLSNLLNTYRDDLEEATYMMKAIIIAAMPSYTDEDLDKYTLDSLLKKMVLAEKVITVQQAASGIPEDMAVLFAFGGQEQQEPQQKTEPINKDKLLSKITSTERGTSGTSVAREVLEKFDEDTLMKISGNPAARDPIAEKLRQTLL